MTTTTKETTVAEILGSDYNLLAALAMLPRTPAELLAQLTTAGLPAIEFDDCSIRCRLSGRYASVTINHVGSNYSISLYLRRAGELVFHCGIDGLPCDRVLAVLAEHAGL